MRAILRISHTRGLKQEIGALRSSVGKQIAESEGVDTRLSPEAAKLLREYSWSGNVRELKISVYSAIIMASTDLTADCFPPEVRNPDVAAPPGDYGLGISVGMTLADVERRLIVATLSRFDGSKTKAAAVLGIRLKTLYNRLQEYRKNGPI